MSMSPFERMLIARGGQSARLATMLYKARTRKKTKTTKTSTTKISSSKSSSSSGEQYDPSKHPSPPKLGAIPKSDGVEVVVGKKFVETSEPLPVTPTYTYGTGTPEQLTGKSGGYAKPDVDKGFYKPSVVQERKDRMALEKGHIIGRTDEGKQYTIKVTPELHHHGYNPSVVDPTVRKTYDDALKNTDKYIVVATQNIDTAKTAEGQIDPVKKYISQLENAPEGAKATYTEYTSTGEEILHKDVEPSKALVFFRSHLVLLEDTAKDLSSHQTSLKTLENQKSIIEGYAEQGWVLEEKGDEYTIERPKSADVYIWKHGDMSGVALSSASFLSSPLAIQTIGSAAHHKFTGDPKVRKAELERLSKYALGLDVAIARGDYAQHVIASPAMIEGVYLPALTLGASKLISVGAGSLAPYVASGSSKLSSVVTRTIGRTIPTTLKVVVSDVAIAAKPILSGTARVLGTPLGKQTMKYGLYLGLEGKQLLETAATHPEAFGGVATRSLFNWELQWRAMETGFKGTDLHSRKGWVEKDILKTKSYPPTVRDQKIVGRIDVVHKPVDKFKGDLGTIHVKDTSKFGGTGKVVLKTEGDKPITVLIDAYGKTKHIPIIKSSEAEGTVMFRWMDKSGLKKHHYFSVRPFESTSTEISRMGKIRNVYSIEKTMGRTEPYTSESISSVLRLGKTDKASLDMYFSKGKYENVMENIVGEHRLTGLIYGLKKGEKGALDIGGKLSQKLISTVKPKPTSGLVLSITKPVQTATVSIGTGIATTVKDAATKPIGTGSSMLGTITLKTGGKTISVSGDKLISQPKDIQRMNLLAIPQVITSTRDDTKTRTKTMMGLETVLGTKELQKTGTGLITDPRTKHIDDQIDITIPTQIQYVGSKQSQKQLQGSLTQQDTTTVIDTELSFADTVGQPIPTVTVSGMSFLLLDDKLSKKKLLKPTKAKGKGYNVYVKERSMYHGKIIKPTKFKRVNPYAISKKDALALGATITDNSAAISFKVKPTKNKPQKLLRTTKSFTDIGHKFTKKNDVYIEKNKYRLDSPGEQREISLLGRKTRAVNYLKKKKKGENNVRYI